MISFYDTAMHLVDEGKVVDITFLGFSKAFDTVSHTKLLDLLSNCEISRCMTNWLNGRAHRVVVNRATPGWQPVTSSVSQGKF